MGVDDDGEPRRLSGGQRPWRSRRRRLARRAEPRRHGLRADRARRRVDPPIAGYDSATRLIYHPEVDHGAIRENPLRSHVDRPATLSSTVCDPSPSGGVCRAVWLAAVLTRFCRFVLRHRAHVRGERAGDRVGEVAPRRRCGDHLRRPAGRHDALRPRRERGEAREISRSSLATTLTTSAR